MADPLQLGAHLISARRWYVHHGIYVGEARVIHYAGLGRRFRRGPVEEVSLAEFARGHAVSVVRDAAARYSGEAVIGRARSRLGEDRYRVLTNNCEHFVSWCITGTGRSAQVTAWQAPLRRALRRLVAWAASSRPSVDAPTCPTRLVNQG